MGASPRGAAPPSQLGELQLPGEARLLGEVSLLGEAVLLGEVPLLHAVLLLGEVAAWGKLMEDFFHEEMLR